jgi:hypothetical protein
MLDSGKLGFTWMADQVAIPAKLLQGRYFSRLARSGGKFGSRLGGWSFQMIKYALHQAVEIAANLLDLCNAQLALDFIVHRSIGEPSGRRTFRQINSVRERTAPMLKIEEFQQYGKEQLDTVTASAASLQSGIHAIASAYGDYTRKSFEDTRQFVEKFSGVKSLDKAVEVQTEYARSAYETFVAEAQKIAGLYGDLAKTTFKPLEGIAARLIPAAKG